MLLSVLTQISHAAYFNTHNHSCIYCICVYIDTFIHTYMDRYVNERGWP